MSFCEYVCTCPSPLGGLQGATRSPCYCSALGFFNPPPTLITAIFQITSTHVSVPLTSLTSPFSITSFFFHFTPVPSCSLNMSITSNTAPTLESLLTNQDSVQHTCLGTQMRTPKASTVPLFLFICQLTYCCVLSVCVPPKYRY